MAVAKQKKLIFVYGRAALLQKRSDSETEHITKEPHVVRCGVLIQRDVGARVLRYQSVSCSHYVYQQNNKALSQTV